MNMRNHLETVAAATEDVFETMVFRTLEREPGNLADACGESNVVASVAFTGPGNGVVTFYSSRDAARAIAALMLGTTPDNVDAELPDAIGEVANMIAGGFRTRMLTTGDRFEISVPTITMGRELTTSYSSAVERAMCAFTFDNHRVFVELAVTNKLAH